MEPLVLASIATVVASPLVGRLAGYLVARGRALPPKRARAVMPEPPQLDVGKEGSAEDRYERNVGRATKALRRHLLEGDRGGVTAASVATALAIHPEVASAALDRLRSRVPCRLRVTRAGAVIHDFDRAALAARGGTSFAAKVGRAMLFVAGLVTNLGAAWPLFFSLFVGALALAGLDDPNNPNGFLVAVGVVLLVPLSFLFVLGGGVLVGAVLTPLDSTPKLGNALPGAEPPKEDAATPVKEGRLKKRQRERARRREATASGGRWQSLVTATDGFGLFGVARTVAIATAAVGLPVLLLVVLAHLFHVTVGLVLLAICGIALAILFVVVLVMTKDGEAAMWITPLVVLAILLGIVLLAFVGIVVWLIGLFMSIFRDRPALVSPGEWAQRRHAADDLSELVPTNDLVIRLYASLSRHLRLDRPVDPTMSVRLASLAGGEGRRLSSLDIAFSEGVDLEAAISLGARFSAHAKGEIHVSDEGDLDFSLPESMAEDARPVMAEAIERNAGDYVAPKGIPVNIPGITLGDIEGAERLGAGSTLAFLTLLAIELGTVTRSFPGFTWHPPTYLLPAAALLVLGAFTLTGVARYVARGEAKAGVWRDVRRSTMKAIDAAIERDEDAFDARALASVLHRALSTPWPTLTRAELCEVIEAVCDELGLELSSEAMVEDRGARAYVIGPLRTRRRSLTSLRRGEAVAKDTEHLGDDEIIFDTASTSVAVR